MNTRTVTIQTILLALLAVACSSTAVAQEPEMDPQLPGTPMTRMLSGMNPMNWSMPKLKMPSMSSFLPTKQEKERVITKKDGLMSEVSTTAKKSWQRTKDTLNPMRLIPAGFKQNAETTPVTAEPKQRGFFSSLFAPFPEEEEEITKPSVNDFLKQEPIR
ncbi:MAG: hypothetical protein KDB00_11875 [Planctomycetales bacterium]|nr:hypothetical protein [Planctomycetales bacterium]